MIKTDGIRCSICFEDCADFSTLCSHTFHRSCFDSWYAKDKSCPYCRSKNPILSLRMCIKNGDMAGFNEIIDNGSWKHEIYERGSWLVHYCVRYGSLEMMKTILPYLCIDKFTRNSGDTPLMIACKRKNLDMVQLLIEEGADLDLTNDAEESALDICISLGAENIFRLLLDDKPCESTKDQAIITAAYQGSLFAIKLLHKAGVNLAATEALIAAASENKVDIMEYLLKNGLDINSRGFHNETPLISACWHDRLEAAKYLVDQGCLIHLQTKGGENALMAAANSCMVETVAMLIEKGASLVETDENERDALINAIEGNDLNVVKLIIEAAEKVPVSTAEVGSITGSNLSAVLVNRRSKKTTPLNIAIRKSSIEIVTYLVEKGANVNQLDENGRPYFMTACSSSNLEVVRYFVEQIGCDIETSSTDGLTGLMLAASAGNVQVVSYLLDRGAKIDRVADDKWSALNFAADAEESDCVEILAARGANLNVVTAEGDTALIIACKLEDEDCVSVLMKAGADSNIPNETGRYPLQIAVKNKDFPSVKHLVEGGADLNIFSDNPERLPACPLVMAMMSKSVEIVEYLLQNGAKVSLVDSIGRSPLHMACIKRNVGVARALIKHGACMNHRDSEGVTPLMMSADSRHIEMVKLFLDHGADPNIIDAAGNTVLMRLIMKYTDDCVYADLAIIRTLVIRYHVDADFSSDGSGKTARKLVAESGDPALLQRL